MSHKYLDYIRAENKKLVSKCFYCKKQSTGINCIKHQIVFVCNDHFKEMPKVQVDTSVPGVIHYIYPEGKKPGLMDPNIGGWFGASDK